MPEYQRQQEQVDKRSSCEADQPNIEEVCHAGSRLARILNSVRKQLNLQVSEKPYILYITDNKRLN